MAIVFALMGLYLHLEKGFTGREVQLAHMKLAREKHQWPPIALPQADSNGLRGAMSAADVMRHPAGPERDAAIDDWCRAVWTAYAGAREAIVVLMKEHGIA